MSMETDLWIVCDRCGTRWHSAPTKAAARKDAVAAGWSADKESDKDYCPVCTQDRISETYGLKQLRLPFLMLSVEPETKKVMRVEYNFGITHIVIGDDK